MPNNLLNGIDDWDDWFNRPNDNLFILCFFFARAVHFFAQTVQLAISKSGRGDIKSIESEWVTYAVLITFIYSVAWLAKKGFQQNRQIQQLRDTEAAEQLVRNEHQEFLNNLPPLQTPENTIANRSDNEETPSTRIESSVEEVNKNKYSPLASTPVNKSANEETPSTSIEDVTSVVQQSPAVGHSPHPIQ